MYTFTNVIPNVTAAEPVFDTSLNEYHIKLTGTGFTGDTSNVELWLDEV
jgi:hypothetical protein